MPSITAFSHVSRFAETRTGMDHLSLQVPSLQDLQEWKHRFEEHGVDHSEIKERAPGQP